MASLPDDRFSQKDTATACADPTGNPPNAKTSYPNYWHDCDGNDNHLQIDLIYLMLISMVKIGSHWYDGWAYQFVLHYSTDGTNWSAVEDETAAEFVRIAYL